jgi:ATP-dependent DNA ligase
MLFRGACPASPIVFGAFDLLFLNGNDLRTLPLIERKATLKRLLRRNGHASCTSTASKVTVACYTIRSSRETWRHRL